MLSNTLKVNLIIFVGISLAISGGSLAKKSFSKEIDPFLELSKNTQHYPILSDISTHPALIFHPHSKHYIYKNNTVEKEDQKEYIDLAIKLKELPTNFPKKITLGQSLTKSTITNFSGTPLTTKELYLISKYWLQLLPHFHPELLKCLSVPGLKPVESGHVFPTNCPSEILYGGDTNGPEQTINGSFNIPYKFYKKIQKCDKCENGKCLHSSKNCTNCECMSNKDIIKKTSKGPLSWSENFIANFTFFSPNNNKQNKQNVHKTNELKNQIPRFTFPLPYIHNSPHESNYPFSIFITVYYMIELNKTAVNFPHNSIELLVSKIHSSPELYKFGYLKKLTHNSPASVFFKRYLATLYALIWSHFPNSLPQFKGNSTRDAFIEFNSSKESLNSPLLDSESFFAPLMLK